MRIYNSLTREKEDLVPIDGKKIGIYVCGPTVYDEPHIGHARSAYIFDMIRRYLVYKGYEVKFVRNVTDVDDKILDKACREGLRKIFAEEGSGISDDMENRANVIAKKYLDLYHRDMDILGIGHPDKEPKATEYVPKMIRFIEDLIKGGAAYETDGNIYFDIGKSKNYGKLSNQNVANMEIAVRKLPEEGKRHPLDFALWKKMKVGEYGFESPWGKGRPGWHIECSTMSSDILGDEFDIHGGGIDLIFPHHENEIAQSEGAGKKFARYWVHNGLLTINGEKMAKSLGNFISIQDFIKEFKDADYLKLLFLNTHYRHPVDYTAEKIKEMKAQKERFGILFKKLHRKFGNKKLPNGSIGNIEKFRREFEDAMDDDFNTPLALGTLFNMVSECNKILSDEKDDRIFMLQHVKEAIVELSGIFGLSFENIEEEKSDMWITAAIAERDRLRKEKKFKEADEIRKMLDQKGIIIEDTKDNTTWRRKL